MPPRITFNHLDRMPNTRLRFLVDRPSKNKRRQALFICDCGNEVETDLNWVRFLNITSCGCYKAEMLIKKNTKHSQASRQEKTGAYRSWQAMHQRVKNHPCYVDVDIDESWCGEEGFSQFFADMGHRPEGLTLERINTLGGYSKQNCKWATRKEQSNNTRKSRGKYGNPE